MWEKKTTDDIEANFEAMIRDYEIPDLSVGATETVSEHNNDDDNYN